MTLVNPKTSFIDITGNRYGRWTILGLSGTRRCNQHEWIAQCDCGTIRSDMLASTVKHGNSKSCGCLRRELLKAPTANRHPDLLHNQVNPLYGIWMGMKTRCYNLTHPTYRRYGAKGITICPEWLEDFEQFVQDMGPRPSREYPVERMDNTGPYAPGNCKWGTRCEQGRNRHNNRLFTWKGEDRTLIAICELEDIEYVRTYQQVVRQHWPIEKAVRTNQSLGRRYVCRRKPQKV